LVGIALTGRAHSLHQTLSPARTLLASYWQSKSGVLQTLFSDPITARDLIPNYIRGTGRILLQQYKVYCADVAEMQIRD